MWYGGLDVPNSWRVGDELYVGLRFHTKVDVEMAVKHYSMNAHQTFVVVESGLKVLSVRCPNSNEGCPWKLRASMSTKYNNKWVIKKWGGRHTCINIILSQDHNKLDSEFICSCILGNFIYTYFSEMVREDAFVSISLIQEIISGQFNYKVSYRKAWKEKQKAISRVFGDWANSYDLLPRMLECCPGSAYRLETTDYVSNNVVNTRFRKFCRVFWTFKPACHAFNYTKPIIQIDETFLYGKYRSTLLIATTQDGNARVLSIAFAVVDGYTTCKHNFTMRLEQFREISIEIRRWIDGISLEKWSLAHDDQGRRYGHMTTNLFEVVNKILKGARNLPITALIKCTYARLVEYFVQRIGQANAELAVGQRYCTKLMDAMQNNQEEATSHFVRRYDNEAARFEVEEAFNPITERGGHTSTVLLNERKCECGAFQAYRYSCSHVIVACAYVRIDPLTYVVAAHSNAYIK
uniref:SWIM-type domain-containing protein n=1 Tax=Cajanus cajan TaxID=3821 RepID=A0A151R8P0_CAJCA|nr:hypothetical protein KK1_039740 [Cajanus cajan]